MTQATQNGVTISVAARLAARSKNDVVITDKSSIADILNDHFVHIADGVPEKSEQDFGPNFIAHPSIQSILQVRVKQVMTPLNFRFTYTNKTQLEKILSSVNLVDMT